MSTLNTAIQAMIDKMVQGIASGTLNQEQQLLVSKALSALQDNAQWEQALIAVAEYHLQTGTTSLEGATADMKAAHTLLLSGITAIVEAAQALTVNSTIATPDLTLSPNVRYMLPLDTVVKIPADSKPGDTYILRVMQVRTQVDPAVKFPPIYPGESKVLHRFMATGNKVFVPAGLKANFYGTEVEGNRNVNVLCDMAITNVNGVLMATYVDSLHTDIGDTGAPVVATRTLPSQVITATQPVTPPDGATMAIVSMSGGGAARVVCGVGTTNGVHTGSPATNLIGVQVPIRTNAEILVEVGLGGGSPRYGTVNLMPGGTSCFCDACAPGGVACWNGIAAPEAPVSPYPYEGAYQPPSEIEYAKQLAQQVSKGLLTYAGGAVPGCSLPNAVICELTLYGKKAEVLVMSEITMAGFTATPTPGDPNYYSVTTGLQITLCSTRFGAKVYSCLATPVRPTLECAENLLGTLWGSHCFCRWSQTVPCCCSAVIGKDNIPGTLHRGVPSYTTFGCTAYTCCTTLPGSDGIVEITWI